MRRGKKRIDCSDRTLILDRIEPMRRRLHESRNIAEAPSPLRFIVQSACVGMPEAQMRSKTKGERSRGVAISRGVFDDRWHYANTHLVALIRKDRGPRMFEPRVAETVPDIVRVRFRLLE